CTSKTETAGTPHQKKPPKLKSQARPKSETSFATQSKTERTDLATPDFRFWTHCGRRHVAATFRFSNCPVR
ncbi:hypothetical protein, partial [Bradyrhizobium sp. NAS80.1]|uniref:hypothetical protein n=1 Tax=Bradyrhizobium sp. NAS80.1 TaxID=1680159 RepID=UPI001AEFA8E4